MQNTSLMRMCLKIPKLIWDTCFPDPVLNKVLQISGWLALLIPFTAPNRAVAQDLFVTCYGTGNIVRFDPVTRSGALFIAAANAGSQPIVNPVGIAWGPDRDGDLLGDLYITCLQQSRIIIFSSVTGAYISEFPTQGGGAFGGYTLELAMAADGTMALCIQNPDLTGAVDRYDPLTGTYLGRLIPGGFSTPRGITFGPAGDVYVSANAGSVRHYNGTSGAYLGDVAALPSPHRVVFGPGGDLFAAQAGSSIIRRFHGRNFQDLGAFATLPLGTPDQNIGLAFGPGGELYVGSFNTGNVYAFNGTTGADLGYTLSLPGILVNATEMIVGPPPAAAIVPPSQQIVACSYFNSAVLRFDGVTGEFSDAMVPSGSGNIIQPTGIALGADNNLYVSSRDNNKVLKYDGLTGTFLGEFVSQVGAVPNGTGDAYDLTFDLTFGPDGTLYVLHQGSIAEGGVGRVYHYSSAGDYLGTLNLPTIYTPRGITVGPDGNLYISCYRPTAGVGFGILRYNINPLTNPGTHDWFVTPGTQLNGPHKLVFQGDSLYVANSQNHSIERYDASTGSFLGTFVTSGSGGAYLPIGLAFGPDGALYAACPYIDPATGIGSQILRYSGIDGAFLGSFSPDHFSGLQGPTYLVLRQGTSIPPDATIVELRNSSGALIQNPGATVEYQLNSAGPYLLFGDGVMNPDGREWEVIPAGVHRFRITYLGSSRVKQHNTTSNSLITFQTVEAVVRLRDSQSVPIADTDAGVEWQAGSSGSYSDFGTGVLGVDGTLSYEVLPGTHRFRLTHQDMSVTKQQNVESNPIVDFATVRVEVLLRDSLDAIIPGAVADIEWQSGSAGSYAPFGNGFLDGLGSMEMEVLPGTHRFQLGYQDASITLQQNVSSNPVVTFRTVRNTVELRDSSNQLISGAIAQIEWQSGSAGTYEPFGDDGTMGAFASALSEVLPLTHRYRLTYQGASISKQQNTATSGTVVFQTTQAVVELRNGAGQLIQDSGAVVSWQSGSAGAYVSFGFDGVIDAGGTESMEVLPLTHRFRVTYQGITKTVQQNTSANPVVVLSFP